MAKGKPSSPHPNKNRPKITSPGGLGNSIALSGGSNGSETRSRSADVMITLCILVPTLRLRSSLHLSAPLRRNVPSGRGKQGNASITVLWILPRRRERLRNRNRFFVRY